MSPTIRFYNRRKTRVNVIEFGSGAGLKTRLLLNNLEDPISYIPVDISLDHLQD
ncbi:L-histidine N(alpha)-methyltransferase, partial [Pseudomonadota bacterium]